MVPVDDLKSIEDPAEKEKILESAWRFYTNGQFIREATNPSFIADLAGDFEQLVPLQDMVACEVLGIVGEHYLQRLEEEAQTQGERLVDNDAKHLRITKNDTDDITMVFDPQDGYMERALQHCRDLLAPFFAASANGFASWIGFTNWLWLNQLTSTLCDLEERVGESFLEGLSERDFEEQLYSAAFGQNTSVDQVTRLLFNYVQLFAELASEALLESSTELWMLEVLLGLRERAPDKGAPPLVVGVDFRNLLPQLAMRPEDLFQLPPRRFEELVAHIFERFGYAVELTPESNDGGYDVIASRRAEIDIRVLIECKRYTPPYKVGRPTLQRLLGVVSDRRQHATKAVLATTSRLLPPHIIS